MKIAGDLPFASSLCRACAEYCPIKIPIPEILLRLRRRAVEGDQVENAVAPATIQTSAKLGALAFGTPWMYNSAMQMLNKGIP